MLRIVDRSDAKPERKRRPQMCVFLVEISIIHVLPPRRLSPAQVSLASVALQHGRHLPGQRGIEHGQALAQVLVHGGLARAELGRAGPHSRPGLQYIRRLCQHPPANLVLHLSDPQTVFSVQRMLSGSGACGTRSDADNGGIHIVFLLFTL